MNRIPLPECENAVQEIISKVGSLTRMLRHNLREMGLEQAIADAAEAIPDARDRLDYVVQMTAQAADTVLSCVEAAQPHQDSIQQQATALSSRWDDWFEDPLEEAKAKQLVTDTRSFLTETQEHTTFTSQQLLSIMMAQDFQDLTGQVIKRMMEVIQEIEHQLLIVLLDNIPESALSSKTEKDALLNGPQINSNGSGVIANQDQVDDLLDSLGF